MWYTCWNPPTSSRLCNCVPNARVRIIINVYEATRLQPFPYPYPKNPKKREEKKKKENIFGGNMHCIKSSHVLRCGLAPLFFPLPPSHLFSLQAAVYFTTGIRRFTVKGVVPDEVKKKKEKKEPFECKITTILGVSA
ncbi:hypothetical protein NPIL_356081 [Nephila pilipes]|uniref:Uncharacterized protein n=1 Tax=Nephila pilipes TaxID=299642 RepID=A0A8X6QPL0_NEPPI|nr:hypothetical protein NPIL_356081 [Nephila pilipes]